MKMKYYAWKNGVQTKGSQEWIELSVNDFIQLCNANRTLEKTERRYFYQLPGIEEGDYYLYLECTYEQYRKSRAERNARVQKKKDFELLQSQGRRYSLVSLDSYIEDDSGDVCTLHDLIADPDSLFEEALTMNMALHNALESLSNEERDLIYELYFDPEGEVSVSELSRQKGVLQQTLNYRKLKILSKIKKMIL